MIALPPVRSLSEAWVLGLELTMAEPGGRLVHLVLSVTEPGLEIPRPRTHDFSLGDQMVEILRNFSSELTTLPRVVRERRRIKQLGFHQEGAFGAVDEINPAEVHRIAERRVHL